MKKWRLFTGVILVLVLGILIGGAGTQFYLRHKYHLSLDRQDRAAHVLKTLSRELDLSAGPEGRDSENPPGDGGKAPHPFPPGTAGGRADC